MASQSLEFHLLLVELGKRFEYDQDLYIKCSSGYDFSHLTEGFKFLFSYLSEDQYQKLIVLLQDKIIPKVEVKSKKSFRFPRYKMISDFELSKIQDWYTYKGNIGLTMIQFIEALIQTQKV